MKKIFIPVAFVLSLTLFSFIPPKKNTTDNNKAKKEGTVKRVSEFSYDITMANPFTPEDGNKVLSIIKDNYQIVDLGSCPGNQVELAAKRHWVFEKKISRDWVETRGIVWDASALPADLAELNAILSRYAQ